MINIASQRLGQVADVRVSGVDKKFYEGEPTVRLCNYTDVYYNDNIVDTLTLMDATASLSQIDRLKVQPGDVIITKDSETADDIGIPAYVQSIGDDVVCGYHLAIIRPDLQRVHPRYLFWQMKSGNVAAQWEGLAKGVTRVSLPTYAMKSLVLEGPADLAVQAAVADFLDRETAKIDAVIERQRALVGGLRERRQETIEVALHQKATGGIVMPLSAACTAIIDCNHSTPAVDLQGKHRAVRTGSVRSGNYRPEFDLLISSETYAERTQGARPAPGDVLFTREAPAGEACLVPTNDVLCLGQRMVLLRPNSSLLHPSFLVYWIYRRSTQDYFRLQMNGSTVGNVRLGDIRSMKIALPSVDKQQAIVDYLGNKTARIDALIALSERLIELSQERRSALITAAVTGQIDVTTDTMALEGVA